MITIPRHRIAGLRESTLLSALTVLIALSPPALATPELRRSMAPVAEAIAKVLQKREQESVAVGPFVGPSTLETAGAGIQKILAEEMEKQQVAVKPRAPTVINGRFMGEQTADGLSLRIVISLVDSLGEALVEIDSDLVQDHPIRKGTVETQVKDERTAIAYLQPTVQIPPDLPPQDRANLVKSSLAGNENAPHIQGTAVFATPSSPYGVEVVVGGKPRDPKIEDGMAFVDIQKGEEYEVRLINNSPHRAAARLMIDGLNSFAFSELRGSDGSRKGEPLYDNWILRPNSQGRIPGWHKRNEGSDNFIAFKVTDYADSAAGLLKQTSNLGTITVVFSAAWEAGSEPPAELKEPPKRRGLPNSTGFGQPKSGEVKPVQVEVGVDRAVVSIRYSRKE